MKTLHLPFHSHDHRETGILAHLRRVSYDSRFHSLLTGSFLLVVFGILLMMALAAH